MLLSILFEVNEGQHDDRGPMQAHKQVVEAEVISSHVQLQTYTHTAKTKQLKARQLVKLRLGLFGLKVKAVKGKLPCSKTPPNSCMLIYKF